MAPTGPAGGGAPPLQRFGPDHLMALATVAAVAVTLVILARRGLSPTASRRLRMGMIALLVSAQLLEEASAFAAGRLTPQIALPLHLCDVNWMLSIAALASLSRRLAEPLYFFAFTGTLPGIITPELPVGFPAVRFVVYFGLHGLVVASAALLTFGFGLGPAPGAWRRALLALNVYALLVTPVNLALGTNFLYLRAKPVPGTPFDWLGPWPWYILSLEAAFLVLFPAMEWPWRRPPWRPRGASGRSTGAAVAGKLWRPSRRRRPPE